MKKEIFFIFVLLIFFHFLSVNTSFSTSIYSFTVSPTTITFPNQDPDQYPEISAAANLTVTFEVRSLTKSQNWVLEIYSDGDLTSGGDNIPIGNVRWTVTGSSIPAGFFQNGTFSKAIYILTGQGPGGGTCNGGGGTRACATCNFQFYLKNFWSYATGTFSRVITLRLTAGTGGGQVQQSKTFTLSPTVAAIAKLNFGLLTLHFPDQDPDSFPTVSADVNPLSVTSSARTGSSSTATLTCLATGDFVSGTNSIPITNMTWTSSGSGYLPGTMSRTIAQNAGSWRGPGQYTGTFNYFLTNLWSFVIGNYSTTINYSLTAP